MIWHVARCRPCRGSGDAAVFSTTAYAVGYCVSPLPGLGKGRRKQDANRFRVTTHAIIGRTIDVPQEAYCACASAITRWRKWREISLGVRRSAFRPISLDSSSSKPDIPKQTDSLAWFELNKQVHVTRFAKIVAENGAEERQPRNIMALAELSNDLRIELNAVQHHLHILAHASRL